MEWAAVSAIADMVTAIMAVVTAVTAVLGARFLIRQSRVDAQMRLYNVFDQPDQAKARRFVFEEMPTEPLSEEEDAMVRAVMVSFNLMAYRVLKGLDDGESTWDLYNRSLIRAVARCWSWLEGERRLRNDPPQYAYCRHATALAARYAERMLRDAGRWHPQDEQLPLPELLRRAETGIGRRPWWEASAR
jgi:hypothetical protein